jgi:hypothetical protein
MKSAHEMLLETVSLIDRSTPYLERDKDRLALAAQMAEAAERDKDFRDQRLVDDRDLYDLIVHLGYRRRIARWAARIDERSSPAEVRAALVECHHHLPNMLAYFGLSMVDWEKARSAAAVGSKGGSDAFGLQVAIYALLADLDAALARIGSR